MSEVKKTSLFSHALIWFGAGVSLAEILTGTFFAPLGFEKGFAAIVLGHIIGCCLLFLAGVIGGKTGKSAMETVKQSFGQKGCLLFAVLNVLQLAGWTAIMIYDGALAGNGILSYGIWLWALVIGALIVLWLCLSPSGLEKLNTIAMIGLLVLSVILCFVIFTSGSGESISSEPAASAMSFSAAVELSAAMPLSWLPLISDYTRHAKKPVAASAVSAVTYGLVSIWMYTIGMAAAIFTGQSDIALILLSAGLGIFGLLIVILSTVTTTYLDAYSAGISWQTIFPESGYKGAAVLVTLAGTIGAMFWQMDDISGFLYLIGSVFTPMIAIQIADFFVLKSNAENKQFDWPNLLVWLAGFILYRILLQMDIPLGATLCDMLVTFGLCILVRILGTSKRKNPGSTV
jgi:putative hydroxymethylpyrimidine transporter CytX